MADDRPDGFSGFGGRPLEALPVEFGAAEDAGGAMGGLSALGLEDAEQVVAAAAVPGVPEELQSALGLDSDAFQALLEAARSVLPAERVALVSQPAPRDLGLGVLPPSPEMLAAAEATAGDGYAAAEAAGAVALASVNLISYMPPIRNQAARGTCVAFTLTVLNEYVLRRRGTVVDLSEQDLYYETKLIDGSAASCGTYQVQAVKVLRDRGESREVVWPYNPNRPCNNHGVRPPGARPDALRHRLATFAVATRSVAAYKAELARQRPVTLSIPVYDSWYQSSEVRRSGRITMRVGNEQASGGHAVCLVGFQDTASSPGGGYFIVRNSWSTTWAYQSPYGAGYGTIPYQYIATDAWEAFSASVPGIRTDGEEGEETPTDTTTTPSSVVIEVGQNVKIRIEST